ncbi:hypothetical protein [Desulfurococcus amylolyticus]|uniref:YL1 domain containing protein n=1 Tax=Desulfurococcus amylolyticus DSM 16532 TaxID=768672 RepID=I3XT86_DESAM|nr:hypothetical protein [Desulfurococcus amylolyticus]AFL67160.1 YL1 domain containing protein [Desulfurococcus amylolyticus DSM 16532]
MLLFNENETEYEEDVALEEEIIEEEYEEEGKEVQIEQLKLLLDVTKTWRRILKGEAGIEELAKIIPTQPSHGKHENIPKTATAKETTEKKAKKKDSGKKRKTSKSKSKRKKSRKERKK